MNKKIMAIGLALAMAVAPSAVFARGAGHGGGGFHGGGGGFHGGYGRGFGGRGALLGLGIAGAAAGAYGLYEYSPYGYDCAAVDVYGRCVAAY